MRVFFNLERKDRNWQTNDFGPSLFRGKRIVRTDGNVAHASSRLIDMCRSQCHRSWRNVFLRLRKPMAPMKKKGGRTWIKYRTGRIWTLKLYLNPTNWTHYTILKLNVSKALSNTVNGQYKDFSWHLNFLFLKKSTFFCFYQFNGF